MVKIESLTVPADFNIIRATRNRKGGTLQVLLGRSLLKSAGFKLDYITETYSFKVGNVEETYHPVRPPASFKNVHQVQLGNGKKAVSKVGKSGSEGSRRKIKKEKELRKAPPSTKKKKKGSREEHNKEKKPRRRKLKGEDRGGESKKEDRTQKKSKNRALARPHTPDGTAARSKNAIFPGYWSCCATAPSSWHLRALGAPSGPPGASALWHLPHSAEATRLPRAVAPLRWLPRAPRALARCPWRVCALDLDAFGKHSGMAVRLRAPDGAPARAHSDPFWAPNCLAGPHGCLAA
ncbi:hypothetical protein PIB30_000515 [Stylosanthes scabra]|uniref:Uncharacterized protein n=1 Tax=Stylosanthes scabra TaxID=79078 RepID=A0ABU6W5W0_9FABA|nr:hypothetical protein [Stylosanthes scabra]